MPLKDLVVHLWGRRATGVLHLAHQGASKTLRLDAGRVCHATSNQPREFLGQYLVSLGHLAPDEVARALAVQKEQGVRLGQVLEGQGLVPTEVLREVLGDKFREAVLDALNWPSGEFTFEAGGEAGAPVGVEAPVPLRAVLEEAERRAAAWERLREIFPTGHHTLSRTRAPVAEPPPAGSLDARVLEAVQPGTTIDELEARLQAPEFLLYERLAGLFQRGHLQVHEPLGPPLDIDVDLGLGDSPTAEQLLENARAFLQRGNCRDAWTLARRSNEVTPTLDASLVLRQVEAAWLPQLRADFFLAQRVPTPMLTAEQVARLPLSAPERYLLARVDGRRDAESIVRLAPLKEFDALAAFDRFVQQRWVRLS